MKRTFRNRSGQTAMELAVFGSILIFTIGLIIRVALSASQVQDSLIKAKLLAFKMSYDYSQGIKGVGGNIRGPDGNASRNSATVLLIEDRMAASSDKYGSLERSQFISSASGTHSRNLLMPVDALDEPQSPVFDLVVNGVHFPLSIGARTNVCLDDPVNIAADLGGDPAASVCVFDGPPPHDVVPTALIEWVPDCAAEEEHEKLVDCPTKAKRRNRPGYGGSAGTQSECDPCNCPNYIGPAPACPGAPPAAGHLCQPPNPWLPVQLIREYGCRALLHVIPNNLENDLWCTQDCFPGGPTPCCDIDPVNPPYNPEANFSADERFDLRRDGTPDVPGAGVSRDDFSWQWYRVFAFDFSTVKFLPLKGNDDDDDDDGDDDDDRRRVSAQNNTDITHRLKFGKGLKIKNQNVVPEELFIDGSFDVDGDLKEEDIQDVLAEEDGVVLRVQVIDYQNGDFDPTAAASDIVPKPQPGFATDIAMLTQTKDGTVLMIENGKLYAGAGADRQFIRTARRKDQVDVIQRVFQLSNYTGRFCDDDILPAGNHLVRNDTHPVEVPPNLEPNPVEVCCDTAQCCDAAGCVADTNTCFGNNTFRTCLYAGDPSAQYPPASGQLTAKHPLLYIRSRVKSGQGRKWITETETDPNVNFLTPLQ